MRHPFPPTISAVLLLASAAGAGEEADFHAPIPLRFNLENAGRVTLVIENSEGQRIRNLIAETEFPAGANVVWWDGADESGGMREGADGVFRAEGNLVAPGSYRFRGLVHDGIDLDYEFSVYSEGSPPWHTGDKTGRWLADHSPPSDVLFLPGSADREPQMLIASFVAEGGDGLVYTDLSGRKLRGERWIGGNWTGAVALARDAGPAADPEVVAYTASTWPVGSNQNEEEAELRLVAIGRENKDRSVLVHTFSRAELPKIGRITGNPPSDDENKRYVHAIAVHNGLLVASMDRHQELALVDAAGGRLLGFVALPGVRGVAFDASGRLLVLAGGRLLRYPAFPMPAAGEIALPVPEQLIADGLEDPQHLALDAEGAIYIGDWGASHQVKVFSADGKPVRVIGTAGAPRSGRYDPIHMNHPNGLAISGDGRLWVAEQDYLPKRVSVWTVGGELVRGFYGPPHYGAGGGIDPRDKSRFYYADERGGAMEFRLDWEMGSSEVVSVISRPQSEGRILPGGDPQLPLYVGDRQYMSNQWSSHPVSGPNAIGIWLMRDAVAMPVAAVGDAYFWDLLRQPEFQEKVPDGIRLDETNRDRQGEKPVLFAWSDLNDDHQVQPDEVTFQRLSTPRTGEMYLAPDFSVTTTFAVSLVPDRFTAGGAPVFDAARAELKIPGIETNWSSGARVAMPGAGGWTVLTGGPLRGYQGGELKWTYPNAWPSLHEGHNAPPQQYPGQLIATTRPLGPPISVAGSDAGEIWAYNGDPGHVYLLTTDGLFLSQLFENGHKASHPRWDSLPATRGTRLNGVAKHGEDFWPTFQQTADGSVYLVIGKEHSSIVQVKGLEKVRRIGAAEIMVTPELLAESAEYFIQRDARRQRQAGEGTLIVSLAPDPPQMDGLLDEWENASWAKLDDKAEAAVMIAGDRLYAAWRTRDRNLLENSGESVPMLFKTGGALDLMLATDTAADPGRKDPVEGDLRLLVTRKNDDTLAVLYRPVSPENAAPVPFRSPWRTVTFDRVDDVSGKVELASGKSRGEIEISGRPSQVEWEQYEVSIPLAELGLRVKSGQQLRADIGILRGEAGQTKQRLYWSNKATGLMNDVPGEAMLTPRLWGIFKLE